jgi:hypothetical protein
VRLELGYNVRKVVQFSDSVDEEGGVEQNACGEFVDDGGRDVFGRALVGKATMRGKKNVAENDPRIQDV